MAGGQGKRFWPASTETIPKQFLRLFGERTLLQQTVDRLKTLVAPARTLVLTNHIYAEAVAAQLPSLPAENILVEPAPRNTAPALALAGLHIRRRFRDVPVVVLPADHYVGDIDRFQTALSRALDGVRDWEGLITFGVRPTRPETAYGYIELGSPVAGELHQVARFKEKPSLEEAERLLADGRHLWNSGMFAWRNECFMAELARHQPHLAVHFEELDKAIGTPMYAARLRECFARVEAISIDYALIERTPNLRVLKVDFPWDDLGSWASLARHRETDTSGNVVLGDAIVCGDSQDCLVYSDGRPIVTLGVRNLVVASTHEGVLVCSRDRCGEIAPLVERLREKT